MKHHLLYALACAGLTALAPLALAQEPSPAAAKAAQSRTPEDPKLVWTASNVVLVPGELAPGVYAVYPDDAPAKNAAGIPPANSGGFVVGDNGVLVIANMLNRRLANQMLAPIREQTKKPLCYVVYNRDPSYESSGKQLLPEG